MTTKLSSTREGKAARRLSRAAAADAPRASKRQVEERERESAPMRRGATFGAGAMSRPVTPSRIKRYDPL